jgi:hypothetical protein
MTLKSLAGQKGRQHTDRLDQLRCHWRGDQRAGSESANGNAGDETAAIRKPFYEHRDRNDVAEPETGPPTKP